MQQASVGFHCPECAASGVQREYRGLSSLRSVPVVTQVLIGINVVAYVAMIATRSVEPFSDWGKLIARAYGDMGLFADGALLGPAVPSEPWRLLTSGFLHSNEIPGGILHIGLNMWALWIFGRMLEPALGRVGFVVLYLTALFGGSLGVVIQDPTALTIGASGAVYGLLATLVVVAVSRGIDLMRSGIAATVGFWLLWTFAMPGISIGGHIGGLVAGGLAAAVMVLAPRHLGDKGPQIAVGITAALGVAFAVAGYLVMASEYPSF